MKNAAYTFLLGTFILVLTSFKNQTPIPKPQKTQVECVRISDTTFNQDTQITRISTFKYDEFGKTVLLTIEQPLINQVRTKSFKYDANGGKIEEYTVTKTNQVVTWIELIQYTLNDSGKVLSEVQYNNGEYFWRYDFTYYSNGQQRSRKHIGTTGNVISSSFNKLDIKGRIVKAKNIENSQGKILGNYNKRFYDDNDVLTKIEWYKDFELTGYTTYEYANGLLNFEKDYDPMGNLTFVKEIQYENGKQTLLLGLTNGTDLNYKIITEYDDKGNAVKFTYEDPNQLFVTTNVYTYGSNDEIIRNETFKDGVLERINTYSYKCP